MDCYGCYCRPENIQLPDGTYFDFNRPDNESIVREILKREGQQWDI